MAGNEELSAIGKIATHRPSKQVVQYYDPKHPPTEKNHDRPVTTMSSASAKGSGGMLH